MALNWTKLVQLLWAGNFTKQKIRKMLFTSQKASLFWWILGNQHKALANA